MTVEIPTTGYTARVLASPAAKLINATSWQMGSIWHTKEQVQSFMIIIWSRLSYTAPVQSRIIRRNAPSGENDGRRCSPRRGSTASSEPCECPAARGDTAISTENDTNDSKNNV
jgi:hypothetical protein